MRSVRRFSFLKWGVSGLLLALLLLTWLARNEPQQEAPGAVAGGRISSADGGSPTPASLALDIGADGAVKVQGVVADEATRNRWLNEIRIGAQGARVVDELRIDTTSPATASGWSGQLASLIASMRERRLEGLRVEGSSVLVRGVARNAADKDESDKVILAQLPPGYRLDSKVSIGTPGSTVPGSANLAASPSAARPQAPAAKPESRAAGSSDRTVTSRSGGDQRAAEQKTAEQKSAEARGAEAKTTEAKTAEARKAEQKAADRRGSDQTGSDRKAAVGNPGDRAAPEKLAQAGGRQNTEAATGGAAPKPAGCPAQLRSLAQPVYFKTDVASLSTEDKARLQRLGECLGSSRVRVVGHADPRLGGEYNQGLSERRARAVADALRAGGLPTSRISVLGAGQAKPAPAASPDTLQRSRRVDIEIR